MTTVARVTSAQPDIIRASVVSVEADVSHGLHSFSVVGLAGKAIEEARDRVASAIKHSGFESPKVKNHKIVISLAPADIKKDGPLFDMPIALAYLTAAELLTTDLIKKAFVGELGLDGTVRGVRGILTVVATLRSEGTKEIYVPYENAHEAALISGITVYAVRSLGELVRHLDHTREDHEELRPFISDNEIITQDILPNILFEDIRGQAHAKRGLTIAAAGRHNTLMIGPPGTGKTMLARAFEGILPPLSNDEALEVTGIRARSREIAPMHSSPARRFARHTTLPPTLRSWEVAHIRDLER
jgi:magnesium chelatase family protein